MDARRNRTTSWPFRDSSMDSEDNVAMNQRMVKQLLKRKPSVTNLPTWQSQSLAGLGIEVSQSREENAGRSLKEAAKKGDLDPAFLALVESGKALPSEITKPVLKSLSKGVKAKTKDLESAMAVQHSRVLERDSTGLVKSALISLCTNDFLIHATSLKLLPCENPSYAAMPIADDNIDSGYETDIQPSLHYKIESLSPPSLSLFVSGDLEGPLQKWNVRVQCGLQEIVSGVTDDKGLFKFPSKYKGFPENAHMLIWKPN